MRRPEHALQEEIVVSAVEGQARILLHIAESDVEEVPSVDPCGSIFVPFQTKVVADGGHEHRDGGEALLSVHHITPVGDDDGTKEVLCLICLNGVF